MSGRDAIGDVFAGPSPRVFSIEPGRPFLKDLATGILNSASFQADVSLADLTIYLPTRRAARGLRDQFRAQIKRAVILPRIQVLGDVDEDEALLFEDGLDDDDLLAPPISSTERLLSLARFVIARDRALSRQTSWASAIAVAQELAKLLDSIYTEEVELSALFDLAPENLAEHWAHNLDFLKIITSAWPDYLAERQRSDPSHRRVKLIEKQRKLIENQRDDQPILIAGTTGSTPAVARLMRSVSRLERGCVVLPGLDLSMPAGRWAKIDDPHPQNGLKNLLDRGLELDRADIRAWPGDDLVAPPRQAELINVALCPANATESWREWISAQSFNKDECADLAAIEIVEAENTEREAEAICIKIRMALEVPDKTISVITPDRDLARRVSSKLQRWRILVDDSAGIPFSQTRCGGYLRLVAAWLAVPDNPAALLAMMRSPLFAGNLSNNHKVQTINIADSALRGFVIENGVTSAIDKIRLTAMSSQPLNKLLSVLEAALQTRPAASAPYSSWLHCHLQVSEMLASTSDQAGDERLWSGDDGGVGADALAGFGDVIAAIDDVDGNEMAVIFDRLIAPLTVRHRSETHPRITIFGPLEARLQHADVTILGGLNEGVWPRDAAIDPFLASTMRKKIGLPSTEQRIGLAAHDFAQLAAGGDVMLTRAIKVAGKPSTPSRWIVRLKNILEGAGLRETVDRTGEYDAHIARLQAVKPVRIEAPSPRPPLEARPKTFFVTRIEQLLRNPYAVYARDILRLKKLEPVGAKLESRHIGSLLHSIFERYVKDGKEQSRDEAVKALSAYFEELSGAFGLSHSHRIFWRGRIDSALDWFADWDRNRRGGARPVILEDVGEWRFAIAGEAFTLRAKADRIDMSGSGHALIVDYKSGQLPPTSPQEKKFSPQLPLTALIVENGGFEKLGPVSVEQFEYIKVLNRSVNERGDRLTAGQDCRQSIEEAERGLLERLAYFQKAENAYLSQPRPQFVHEYSDYDHLARRRERNAHGGEE